MYPSSMSVHVPPFSHGLLSHSLVSTKHIISVTHTNNYISNLQFKSHSDKDKDLFIGLQEFVVGYSKAPEQP